MLRTYYQVGTQDILEAFNPQWTCDAGPSCEGSHIIYFGGGEALARVSEFVKADRRGRVECHDRSDMIEGQSQNEPACVMLLLQMEERSEELCRTYGSL